MTGGMPPRARIRRVHPLRNLAGTMLAFVSAEAPSGIIYNGVRLMVGPRGKRWIAMPDVKRRDENDQVVLTAARMPIYDPVIEFRDRATCDRSADMVLDALRRSNPEFFSGEPDR